MKVVTSRVTAQGQVSIPAEVRKRLGVTPGSVIEWDVEGDAIVVRRARRYTSADIHDALFPEGAPPRRTIEDLKNGIRKHMKDRHARG